MEARVKAAARYGTITAFTGMEYVKYEWRRVPAGCEAEAEKHPYLETKSEPQKPDEKVWMDLGELKNTVDAPKDDPVKPKAAKK